MEFSVIMYVEAVRVGIFFVLEVLFFRTEFNLDKLKGEVVKKMSVFGSFSDEEIENTKFLVTF